MGFSDGPTIVTNGLVLSLDAADRNSYVSGSTVWNDLSGNNNSGSLTNGPTFNSANGGSIVFNGTNQNVAIASESSGSATGNYTWEVWCKTSNASKEFNPLVRGRDNLGNGWSIQARISPTTLQFAAGIVTTVPSTVGYDATSSIALGVTASLETWYCITGVWTAGSKVDLYVNGVLSGTKSTTSTSLRTSTVGWSIASIATTNFSTGSIANAKVYNRALSSDEIQQNYNAQKSRFGL
jgi:hypothetical protein